MEIRENSVNRTDRRIILTCRSRQMTLCFPSVLIFPLRNDGRRVMAPKVRLYQWILILFHDLSHNYDAHVPFISDSVKEISFANFPDFSLA